MANIITDLSGEKVVRMTDARFARQPLPAFFTGWSHIRVALFLQMGDSGANITGTPRFAVGVCAGSTDIMGDATTTHFAGVISNIATWTRSTSPVRYSGTTTFVPSKKVVSTLTTGTAFTGSASILHTTAPFMFFIDIIKGSPNYSFQFFRYTSGTAPAVTEADFLTQSVATIPAFTNHSYSTAQTVAVDEATDGTFDHGCVWWDQAVCNMDILTWRMYRIA